MPKFYLTTPIFYINDIPHVGHAYTMIAASVTARYHTLLGDDVFFLTGTDENSQKTLAKATELGKDPAAFTDEMAMKWSTAWAALGITPNRFIRTTENEHRHTVAELLKTINDTGDIYKGKYDGLYCIGCEEFKNEKDLLANSVCPLHLIPCQQISEENYFFRLSKYRDILIRYIKEHEEFIKPDIRRNEALGFLRQDLKDISISRPNKRWGIPLPFDKSHVVYVWFDALMNYITGAGYKSDSFQKLWPPDLQFIGKDILKFHVIIWPAILLSLKMKLPKTIFAHGFFTIAGQKISKSLGNVINPISIAQKYGATALTYYLLSGIPFGGDGDFDERALIERYNSDLANTYGNAIQRIAGLSTQRGIMLPSTYKDFLTVIAHNKPYQSAMDSLQFSAAIEYTQNLLAGVNQVINKEAPWKLTNRERLAFLLHNWAAQLSDASYLLEPFIGEKAQKARSILTGTIPTESIFPKIEAA